MFDTDPCALSRAIVGALATLVSDAPISEDEFNALVAEATVNPDVAGECIRYLALLVYGSHRVHITSLAHDRLPDSRIQAFTLDSLRLHLAAEARQAAGAEKE